MIVGVFQTEQQAFQFDFQPMASAGEFAPALAIIFAIGFILLTIVAYLYARGYFSEPFLGFISLLILLAAAFFYLSVAFFLIYPQRHQRVDWIPEHYEWTYPINAALGVGWIVASYAWLRFTLLRFTVRFTKR